METIHAATPAAPGALARGLRAERFVRVHRSVMLNLDRMGEMEPYFHSEHVVRLADGTRLRMSRTYRDRLHVRVGHAR